MRKLCALLLALALLCTAASAETITAVASDVNPERLACTAVHACITGYDPAEGLLDVELIVPERFAAEDVLALRPGDAIYTQGREVEIRTIAEDSGYLVLNAGDYEFSEGSVWLWEGTDGCWWVADWHDCAWNTLARLRLPVPDTLLLLDGIDPATGEILALPAVHAAADFLAMLQAENAGGGPGFAAHNVRVVFGADGRLAVVERYYVEWQ